MKTKYTRLRQFYAWIGFLSIPTAMLLAAYVAFDPRVDECIVSEEKTHTEQFQASDDMILKAILATTTEQIMNEIDSIENSDILRTIRDAKVTGYNTLEAQTDSTPCIAADGSNICGRHDTVACPSNIEFGTKVFIYGRIYECTDRTHEKHDGRFDINCNLDLACPAAVTSYTTVQILK